MLVYEFGSITSICAGLADYKISNTDFTQGHEFFALSRSSKFSSQEGAESNDHQGIGDPPIRTSSRFARTNGFGGERKTAPLAVIAAGWWWHTTSTLLFHVPADKAAVRASDDSNTSRA
jgi:hypothetical protein